MRGDDGGRSNVTEDDLPARSGRVLVPGAGAEDDADDLGGVRRLAMILRRFGVARCAEEPAIRFRDSRGFIAAGAEDEDGGVRMLE